MSRIASANECEYSVTWSEEDGIYTGHVAEFPSLTAHGDSPAAALAEIRFVVEATLEDLVHEKGGRSE